MSEYKNISHLRVVDVPIHQIRKIEIVQLRGKTMGEWYNAQTDKPKYMLNGSLWDSKGAIGTIWQDGKAVNNPTDNWRCPNAIAIWTYDEKKEDDKITRGEVFALLDQVVK